MSMLSFPKLLVTVLALAHHSGATKTTCNNILPGISKMASGVDLTSLDLFPLRDSDLDRKLLKPFMNTTFVAGREYVSAASRECFDVPVEVKRVITPDVTELAGVKVYRSYHQVKDEMINRVRGLNSKEKPIVFAKNPTYADIQRSFSLYDQNVIDVEIETFTHDVYLHDVRSEEFLLPSFKAEINKLEGLTFRSNRVDFLKFIEAYGTHFIRMGRFGGMVRKYMETSLLYARGKTDEELEGLAVASCSGELASFHANVNTNYVKKEEMNLLEFKNATKGLVRYYGGDLNQSDFKGWLKTVEKNPVLLQVRLSPFSRLVRNKMLRKEMKMAIVQQLAYTFLNYELSRKLKFIRDEQFHIDTADKNVYAENWGLIDLAMIRKMDDEIVYHTEFPIWFLQDTRLCVKHAPRMGGINKCNENTVIGVDTSCSLPNDYTPTYVDTPTKASCDLYWGVVSPKSPKWFHDVTLCTRQLTESNGEKSVFVVRKTINNFAGPIWDFFSKREANILSWKIQLPKKAPLWLKKSKLCFSWEAKDNSSYSKASCAVPKKKDVCVGTEEWTDTNIVDYMIEYYKTQCRMMWSWKTSKMLGGWPSSYTSGIFKGKQNIV